MSRHYLTPPQDHSIFYYELDFSRNEFKMLDCFGAAHRGHSPRVHMLHLSRCFEYRFYRIQYIERSYQFSDGKGFTRMFAEVEEEMERNEFFSQYALGTLERNFIVTRDVKYLMEYLTQTAQTES